MRVLAKIGGAWLEQAAGRAGIARSVARARAAGHEVLLAHGGGNQIRTLGRRLGIADRYVDGLRVTDAEVAEMALMVLGGSVNRTLVAALQAHGVPAVGLTGADGGSFRARRYRHRDGQDLGFVGDVAPADVDRRLVDHLLAGGFLPVLATVAPGVDAGGDDPFFNVNADQAAGPLAGALGAAALLFLTDVPGVLDGAGRLLPRLSPADCSDLRARGVIAGGMIPKVEAALLAAAAAPGTLVKITPAAGDDAIVRALAPDVGTAFSTELSAHG